MDELRIGVVAMNSLSGRKHRNLERMEAFIRRGAEQKVQWICFPELSISGYSLEAEALADGEPIPGPSTDTVHHWAKAYGMLILTGLIEKGRPGEFFISHVALSPSGWMGVYRKTHLGPAEMGRFQSGKEIPVFEEEGVRFGIQLCYDGHFPEVSRIQALQGAEVIFIPHASPRETTAAKQQRWFRYLASRAYDNGVFVVACNQAGENGKLVFSGGAMVFSPRGEVMAQSNAEGEDWVVAHLKGKDLRDVRESPHGYFLPHRRPELYHALVKPFDQS